MTLFGKLFGGGEGKAPEPDTYEGYTIFVEPIREGASFRLAARIEKEVGGAVKSHRIIRADTFNAEDEARQYSLAKAKQLIDQMGDRLFD